MYKIIACISSLLRCYAFPNPFENLIRYMLENTMISSSYIQVAIIFNFAFGGFLIWLICYPLVGIIYRKGEAYYF